MTKPEYIHLSHTYIIASPACVIAEHTRISGYENYI
jgi:hypothetical protein